MKLNFTFFCVPRQKLLLYITFKVVSNVTKSSASDDLLHVNCNITNRTQTYFWSAQVFTRCVGTSIILKALLFLFCCYCWKSASPIRLSFVLFQGFCSLLWWFLHRRKCCWLQILLWYAVFNKVCKIAFSEVLATQMGVMKHSQSQLIWNAQIWSIFTSQRVNSVGTHA